MNRKYKTYNRKYQKGGTRISLSKQGFHPMDDQFFDSYQSRHYKCGKTDQACTFRPQTSFGYDIGDNSLFASYNPEVEIPLGGDRIRFGGNVLGLGVNAEGKVNYDFDNPDALKAVNFSGSLMGTGRIGWNRYEYRRENQGRPKKSGKRHDLVRHQVEAGVYGNYDILNKNMADIGIYGRYGKLNANLGYDLTNKQIKAGIGLKFQKGGIKEKEDPTQEQILNYHEWVSKYNNMTLEEVQESSKYNIMNPESTFYVSHENRAPTKNDTWGLYKNIGWNLTSIFPDYFGEDEEVDLDLLASDKSKLAYINAWEKNKDIESYDFYGEKNEGITPVQGNVYSTEQRDYILNDLQSSGYRIRLTRELALDKGIDQSEVTNEMLDKVIGARINNLVFTQEFSGYPGEYTDIGVEDPNSPMYDPDYLIENEFSGIGGAAFRGNLPYSRIYYGKEYEDDYLLDEYGGVQFHELIHATAMNHGYRDEHGEWVDTGGGLSDYASNLLTQAKIPHKLKGEKPGQIPEKAYWYGSDDDEVYTRYKKAQRMLKDKGIYDHTTGELMTDEEYTNLKTFLASDEFMNFGQYDDIREFFGTDMWEKSRGEFDPGAKWNEKLEEQEIRNIFDNVADLNTEMPAGMAKYGGIRTLSNPKIKIGVKRFKKQKRMPKVAMNNFVANYTKTLKRFN